VRLHRVGDRYPDVELSTCSRPHSAFCIRRSRREQSCVRRLCLTWTQTASCGCPRRTRLQGIRGRRRRGASTSTARRPACRTTPWAAENEMAGVSWGRWQISLAHSLQHGGQGFWQLLLGHSNLLFGRPDGHRRFARCREVVSLCLAVGCPVGYAWCRTVRLADGQPLHAWLRWSQPAVWTPPSLRQQHQLPAAQRRRLLRRSRPWWTQPCSQVLLALGGV